MKFKHIFALCLTSAMLASCGTPKDITYFQEFIPGSQAIEVNPEEITIRPGDKLSIIVNSQDARLTSQFNLPIVGSNISAGMDNSTAQSRGLSGYTVNAEGSIEFPVLGLVEVAGLTREKVADRIRDELRSRDLVRDAVVTVEFMNLTITVLGEVANPGRVAITKDNVTVLDAIALAGDLTIFGDRTNVRVLRYEGGKEHCYMLNLTDAHSVFTSEAYNLNQGDIVYVDPNDTRKRQSTVNGNNVRSTSFWISLASLLCSVAVLIFK